MVTPLFLAILLELFGARDSSKSLIIASLELLFVSVACFFNQSHPITCLVKRILCKRYLKFADYMASGIYAHRWVWSLRCFLCIKTFQTAGNKQMPYGEAVKSVKDVGYLWQLHVEFGNMNLSPAKKTEHLPRATHLYIQKCMSSP